MIQIVFSTYRRRTTEEETKEKEKEQAEAHKRTLDEMKQEGKRLHGKLEQLTSEHTAVEEAMQRGIGFVEEGGAKIKNALAKEDMIKLKQDIN